jgi:hypothetical protein
MASGKRKATPGGVAPSWFKLENYGAMVTRVTNAFDRRRSRSLGETAV